MPHRLRREPDDHLPEDTTYVYSRAEDRSFWARTSAALEKYKLLMWILVPLAVAAGFGFRTPAQAFDEIHQKIDRVQVQVDTLKRHEDTAKQAAAEDRRALTEKIDALIRLRCIESERQHRLAEARLAGLNC